MKRAAVISCLAAAVWSAAGADLPPPVLQVQGPSVVFSLVRILGALSLVFALFLTGIWLFRNWQRLAFQRAGPPKLYVLEVKSLGSRHALYVVGYEQQRFLLSSAPTGVSFLTALPVAAASTEAPATAGPSSFTELLAGAVGQK